MKGLTIIKETKFPSINVEISYVNGNATSFTGCNKVEISDVLLVITINLTNDVKKHIVPLCNVCELSVE